MPESPKIYFLDNFPKVLAKALFSNGLKANNENFVVFALKSLENKAFAKTLRKLYKKDIFGLSDTIGACYGATHKT